MEMTTIKSPGKKQLALVFLIIVICAAINLFSIADYPALHCDEAGSATVAWQTFTTGKQTFGFLAEQNAILNELGGRFFLFTLGAWLAVFGRSPLAGRLLSVIGWLISSWLVYQNARALNQDRQTSVISVLVFATGLNVFWASHVIRQEIWVLAAIMLLLRLLLVSRAVSLWWLDLLFGFLTIEFALEIHIVALFFCFPFGVLFLGRCIKARSYKRLALYTVGIVLGIGVSGFIHLWPDPQYFFGYSQSVTASHCEYPLCLPLNLADIPGFLSSSLTLMIDFLLDSYVLNFNYLVLLYTLYFIPSLIWVLVRRREEVGIILWLFGLSFFLFLLLMQHKNRFYAPLWDGYFAILVGVTVTDVAARIEGLLSQAGKDSVKRDNPDQQNPSILGGRFTKHLNSAKLVIMLVSPLILINLFAQLWLGIKFAPRDYQAYTGQLLEQIPPGKHVMANAKLWFAFEDRNEFTADWYLSDTIFKTGIVIDSVEDIGRILTDLEIDYAIDSGAFSCAAGPTESSLLYSRYLQDTCLATATVNDRWFGAGGHLGSGSPTIVYQCGE